jgi:phage gp16-like protein
MDLINIIASLCTAWINITSNDFEKKKFKLRTNKKCSRNDNGFSEQAKIRVASERQTGNRKQKDFEEVEKKFYISKCSRWCD